MRVEFVQARILMIFEEMRDRRTLPYLEELVKETTDQALITWIQRTMNSIKSPYPPRTIVVLLAKPENSH
jgi:hypothetical protein